jgi:hypothetical protein
MANMSKVASEAQPVNTARTVEKALPEEVHLSGEALLFRRHRWLVWLGAAVVVLAAVSWGLVWLELRWWCWLLCPGAW